MATRKKKTAAVASDLMLAPWVIAMRMPLLMMESARNPFRTGLELEKAVAEKAAAAFESAGIAQAEMAQAAIRAWGDLVNGRAMDAGGFAKSMAAMTDATMLPAARRVRANYSRLSKR